MKASDAIHKTCASPSHIAAERQDGRYLGNTTSGLRITLTIPPRGSGVVFFTYLQKERTDLLDFRAAGNKVANRSRLASRSVARLASIESFTSANRLSWFSGTLAGSTTTPQPLSAPDTAAPVAPDPSDSPEFQGPAPHLLGTGSWAKCTRGTLQNREETMTTSKPFDPSSLLVGPFSRDIIDANSNDGEKSAGNNLSDSLGQVSKTSISEIDNLISELQTLRRKLQTDGDRIQREIEEYHALSQQVMQLTGIISDSVRNLPTDNTSVGSRRTH